MNFNEFAVDDDVVIWRYMDLSKFLDILVYKNLVFPRLDQFEDVYEGHPSKFLDAISHAFSDPDSIYMRDEVEKSIKLFFKLIKVRGYVSCWHGAKHESAGMWKLYCKTDESLAIKTTVGKLKQSLKTPNSDLVNTIEIGQVDYKDNCEELKNKFLEISRKKDCIKVGYANVVFSKRPSFEHEKEIRVIAFNQDKIMDSENKNMSETNLKLTTPAIQRIECDVDQMIDEVVIAPDAPQWFVELVSELIKKLEYSFPVNQSELYTLK